jgi:hypothetical protein
MHFLKSKRLRRALSSGVGDGMGWADEGMARKVGGEFFAKPMVGDEMQIYPNILFMKGKNHFILS